MCATPTLRSIVGSGSSGGYVPYVIPQAAPVVEPSASAAAAMKAVSAEQAPTVSMASPSKTKSSLLTIQNNQGNSSNSGLNTGSFAI